MESAGDIIDGEEHKACKRKGIKIDTGRGEKSRETPHA